MSYEQYTSHCYACQQPVPTLASRCPHCTSQLGISGGIPYNPNQPASTATALFGWFVAYILIGLALGTWAPAWISTVWWWPGSTLVHLIVTAVEWLDRLIR